MNPDQLQVLRELAHAVQRCNIATEIRWGGRNNLGHAPISRSLFGSSPWSLQFADLVASADSMIGKIGDSQIRSRIAAFWNSFSTLNRNTNDEVTAETATDSDVCEAIDLLHFASGLLYWHLHRLLGGDLPREIEGAFPDIDIRSRAVGGYFIRSFISGGGVGAVMGLQQLLENRGCTEVANNDLADLLTQTKDLMDDLAR